MNLGYLYFSEDVSIRYYIQCSPVAQLPNAGLIRESLGSNPLFKDVAAVSKDGHVCSIHSAV